jgi:DNA polymerase-4
VGISLTNLCDAAAIQLALPFDRSAGLDRALDDLRDRFGATAISRGTLVGQAVADWVPLLDDD